MDEWEKIDECETPVEIQTTVVKEENIATTPVELIVEKIGVETNSDTATQETILTTAPSPELNNVDIAEISKRFEGKDDLLAMLRVLGNAVMSLPDEHRLLHLHHLLNVTNSTNCINNEIGTSRTTKRKVSSLDVSTETTKELKLHELHERQTSLGMTLNNVRKFLKILLFIY